MSLSSPSTVTPTVTTQVPLRSSFSSSSSEQDHKNDDSQILSDFVDVDSETRQFRFWKKMTSSDLKQDRIVWGQVPGLLQSSASFRSLITDSVVSSSHDAIFFESIPVSPDQLDTSPFEYVCSRADFLTRVSANKRPFAKYIGDEVASPEESDAVSVFPNLGGDATLVVPAQVVNISPSSYTHLANFLRQAPESQIHLFWKQVGLALEDRLGSLDSDEPLWLSTHGGGVSWLHMRLDSYPKYYHFKSYKQWPQKK